VRQYFFKYKTQTLGILKGSRDVNNQIAENLRADAARLNLNKSDVAKGIKRDHSDVAKAMNGNTGTYFGTLRAKIRKYLDLKLSERG